MTQLAQDTPRIYELGERNNPPMAASAVIYEGSAVGDNGSGYARQLVGGDNFIGFAESYAAETTAVAGGARATVRSKGRIQLAVSGAVITDVKRPVYASDGATFTFDGAGASYIGHVERFVSAGVVMVVFDAEVPEFVEVVTIPVTLASISAADVLTNYTPGFPGRIVDWDFVTGVPVTTGAKLATLNLEIGTTDVTGGTIALTSAAATPLGKKIAKAAAFTAGTGFGATDTISIEASAVTAFTEGTGFLLLKLGH